MPVPAAPVEFTWAKPDDSEIASADSHTSDKNDTSETGDNVVESGPPALTSVRRSDRRQWVFGSIAAVILLALGWLVVGRGSGDENLDAVEPADTTADTTVEDSLPALDEEPPDTEPAPERTIPGSASLDVEVPEWSEDTIVLPSALSDTTVPFEIVALFADGTFVEVSVPSGQMSVLDLGQGLQAQVIAGATSTLLTSFASRQNSQLLTVGEPPIDVVIPNIVNGMQIDAVADGYAGILYGGRPYPDRVEVAADGSIAVTEGRSDDRNIWQQQYFADGTRLVADAGGLYRGSDGAFTRISSGWPVASSGTHLIVRECDDQMQCGYVLIDVVAGERTEVKVDQELNPFGSGDNDLSPDGRWVRAIDYTESSSTGTLIDLTTGTTTEVAGMAPGSSGETWAADSSGFFRQSTTGGFEFYDIATGEASQFGGDLGRMMSFDIRINASAPVVGEPTPTTTGVGLIGLTKTGDIVEIDVDSRAVVTTEGLPLNSEAPSTIFVEPGGAVISSWDNVPTVRFDAEARTVTATPSLEPSGPVFSGPTSDTVWQVAESSSTGGLAFDLVDSSGALAGGKITTDAADLNDIVGPDGAGGVIVELDLGGIFVLNAADTPELLTAGELLAINAQVAYVRECDSTLRCGVFVLDRVTGERLPIDLSAFDRVGDVTSNGVPSGQNVSPDGQVVFARDADQPNSTMMIDTAEDLWTSVGEVDLASPIIWTPESDYAVWLGNGRVTVYERSTRSVRTVNTVDLQAIAEVPAS